MTDQEIAKFEWAHLENSPVYESFASFFGGDRGIYSFKQNEGDKEVGHFMQPCSMEGWAFTGNLERACVEGIGWCIVVITDPGTLQLRKYAARPGGPLRTEKAN